MQCEKTGCCAYLHEYDLWVYGDSFRDDRTKMLMFRISGTSMDRPINGDVIHYSVGVTSQWWDRDKQVSTLIAAESMYFGYEGRVVNIHADSR